MEEKSVNSIRETFYNDIIYDYQVKCEEERERAFLYRAFWAENVSGLLKNFDRLLSEYGRRNHLQLKGKSRLRELLEEAMREDPEWRRLLEASPGKGRDFWEKLPWLLAEKPIGPGDELRIKKLLGNVMAMEEYSQWARARNQDKTKDVLLRAVPEKDRKERRDFWEELWRNDAGYAAGLITDTDYYLWLAKYLAERDIYYKDNSMPDGHLWLETLLVESGVVKPGKAGTGKNPERAQKPGNGKNAENPENMEDGRSEDIRVKANVGKKLAQLVKLVRKEQDAGGTEIAGRLTHLEISVKNGEDEKREDYLPWLTARLEQMALHIKIKTWLQDSGYPARGQEGARKPLKEPRKQDFSMRLFEAYCDSKEGYAFCRKDQTGASGSGVWHMEGQGFCVLDVTPQQADRLRESLEQDGERLPCVYIPLAVHTVSGCVFFLAGKENYRELYERAVRRPGNRPDAGKALREAYEKAKARYCFDYLRLDKRYWEQFPGDFGGAFRLHPTFHKKQGKNYAEVLEDFKWYCKHGYDSPRRMVKNMNEEMEIPADIQNAFNWAFDNVEEMEISLAAAASFNHTREMADREY